MFLPAVIHLYTTASFIARTVQKDLSTKCEVGLCAVCTEREVCVRLCARVKHAHTTVYLLNKEELGYSTRQLSANADISFLSHIHYQKKIFALCACKFSGGESQDVAVCTEGALAGIITAIGPPGPQGQSKTQPVSLGQG